MPFRRNPKHLFFFNTIYSFLSFFLAVPNPDVVYENVPVNPVSRLERLEPYAKIILVNWVLHRRCLDTSHI